jgi:hypothetical protein
MAWFWRYLSFEPVTAHVIRDWASRMVPGLGVEASTPLNPHKLPISLSRKNR